MPPQEDRLKPAIADQNQSNHENVELNSKIFPKRQID
jgi:hypothetical protein